MNPIELSPNRRMTLEYNQEGKVVEIRLEYRTKNDPEWKPAKGGFNVPIGAVTDLMNQIIALHRIAHSTAPAEDVPKKKKKKKKAVPVEAPEPDEEPVKKKKKPKLKIKSKEIADRKLPPAPATDKIKKKKKE